MPSEIHGLPFRDGGGLWRFEVYNTILSMGGRSCSKHALKVVSDDVLCAESTCNEYPLELGDKMGMLVSP